MKRTRVIQFVERLTGWHYADGAWIRNQPFITFTEEMSVDEARRRFPALPQDPAQWPMTPVGCIGTRVAFSVYEPLTVEVDPWPKRT